MKDQIEFHCMYTGEPFVIDPNQVMRVSKHLDGATIQMNWPSVIQSTIDVSEGYGEVKRRLNDYHFPHKDDHLNGWPYD